MVVCGFGLEDKLGNQKEDMADMTVMSYQSGRGDYGT